MNALQRTKNLELREDRILRAISRMPREDKLGPGRHRYRVLKHVQYRLWDAIQELKVEAGYEQIELEYGGRIPSHP